MSDMLTHVLKLLFCIGGWMVAIWVSGKRRASAAEYANNCQRSDDVVGTYERQVRSLRQQLDDQRQQIEEMVDRSVELRNERDELKDVLAKVETCSYDLDGVLFGDDDPRTDAAESITDDDTE